MFLVADDGARRRRSSGSRRSSTTPSSSSITCPGAGFEFEAEYFRHAQIFFSLYFVMTGLHALHMIIGLGIMAVMLWWAWRGTITRGVLQPDRDQRPLLALRRHRLDFPVPAAVSDRPAWSQLTRRRTSSRSAIYYTIFAHPDALHRTSPWQVAFFDLGPLNTVAALGIAVFKATLVVLFFMHVKYSTRLTWAVVIGSVFWLGILLALTLSDYLTRAWRT